MSTLPQPVDSRQTTSAPLVTLAGMAESQAQRLGRAPFLLFEGRTYSFADLDQESNRVANGLSSLGVGPGTGVAIDMPNCPEWLFSYLATQKLGAYAVPVNIALRGEGLRHVIDHSDAEVLVCGPEEALAVAAVAGGLPKLRSFIVEGSGPSAQRPPTAGWHRLADLASNRHDHPAPAIDAEAISTIIYTSGTTGPAKGVVSRYRSLSVGGGGPLGIGLEANDVLYTCLPLFHANALWLTTVRALAAGLPMVLARRFSASGFWEETRRYGVTTFNALGAMIPILVKQPVRPNDAENPVRVVLSAACPESIWAEFEARFGIRLVEAYAAVDGGGFATINFGQSPRGSIGRPTGRWRIVDEKNGDVPVGLAGELLFRIEEPGSHRVEYYKDPGASRAKTRGGWLHTGDLVRADPDGNLFFVDRKTDTLRRRGENISSWEVERVLEQHPAVVESAVFGVPSELAEDEVMAVVVLREGARLTAEELVGFASERIASFAVPRFVEFSPSLPKTATHRVRKAELKQRGVGPSTWDRQASV